MNFNRFTFTFCFFAFSLFAFEPLIILIGPPGSGKGTCSQHLKERYGYQHVSIGDLLRKEVAMQTELGSQIEEIVRRGDFIDSKIVHLLLAHIVTNPEVGKHPLILDGFTRNPDDVPFMRDLFKAMRLMPRTFILYLEAPDATCLERVAYRSVCAHCGHVYHEIWAKPSNAGHCDLCGSRTQTRINDTKEVILKRLHHHRNCIESYYQEALAEFPSILLDTSGSLEECLDFYDQLALIAASSKIDSSEFTEKINAQIRKTESLDQLN